MRVILGGIKFGSDVLNGMENSERFWKVNQGIETS